MSRPSKHHADIHHSCRSFLLCRARFLCGLYTLRQFIVLVGLPDFIRSAAELPLHISCCHDSWEFHRHSHGAMQVSECLCAQRRKMFVQICSSYRGFGQFQEAVFDLVYIVSLSSFENSIRDTWPAVRPGPAFAAVHTCGSPNTVKRAMSTSMVQPKPPFACKKVSFPLLLYFFSRLLLAVLCFVAVGPALDLGEVQSSNIMYFLKVLPVMVTPCLRFD